MNGEIGALIGLLRGRRTPLHAWKLHAENREVRQCPSTKECAGRLEKDVIQKSNMHVDGKSDGRAVPTKCPNKSGKSLRGGMKGSRPAKRTTEQTTGVSAQSWGDALKRLRGVRERSKEGQAVDGSLRYFTRSVALWRAASTLEARRGSWS